MSFIWNSGYLTVSIITGDIKQLVNGGNGTLYGSKVNFYWYVEKGEGNI